ncbi:MAG: caspase family protein, partial [Betaproteobacteria bacterium]
KLGSFFYLIIGINDYPGDPGDDGYHDLRFAVADAMLLRETLWITNGYAGEVVLLTDAAATKAGILAAIQAIGSKMSEYGQDYFVMTFSGHGGHQTDQYPDPPDDNPQEYIVAADDEVITDDELTDWIQRYIPTDFCLFIFDSCYSGGMTRGATVATSGPAWMKNFRPGLSGLARDLNKYGYVVLMASDDDEVSYEDQTLDGGHGIFTYYLCDGIKTRGADTNPRDGLITAREIFDYAKPLVTAHTSGYLYGQQTPQLYADPTERQDIPIYRVP